MIVACAGCSGQQQQLDYYTQLLCDCGQPVIEWKQQLQSNPSLLNKGGEVEQVLRECLQEGATHYPDLRADTTFILDLAVAINEQCPEINTSVNAMLLILAGEK
ncbi:MAG TPA: hypothetical protein DHW15_07800 [Bacteroidetes bacterium]|jgi:hypothetical protein|nr:MAG: hypothetical protein ABR94_03925 [Sphingobacteriales bacterium BACL12 MAG-120802-bin5]KRP08329.1 MAG: hypothetical protein ABR95_13530 [Sphingobacteriales bacterium BACL12 MAG-120813-bin55]HCK22051.1 hypothetical protein [Bacteroidota bacterium]